RTTPSSFPNHPATPSLSTLSLHDALPIYHQLDDFHLIISDLRLPGAPGTDLIPQTGEVPVLIMTSYASVRSAVDSLKAGAIDYIDRKSTRLNSSHVKISYAVFCLKKKIQP